MRLIKKSLKAGALLLRSTCPECQILLFANESIMRVFFGDTINAYMVSAKGQWLIFVNSLINSVRPCLHLQVAQGALLQL